MAVELFTIGRAVRQVPNDGGKRLGPPDIQWSIDAATETFGILGIKGSGKSTTGRVIVEGLTANGAQCVIIDPTGVWWGLKASRSGDKVGFPFTVIGGPHADIPLVATQQAGVIIAELVVAQDAPLIIDLSEMRKGDQRRFMLGFTETLFHKSRGTKAIHLVIDECDLYVPQMVRGDVAQLVGAVEDIVKRGRVKGLGVTLISQRSASINKDVLTQISVLIAHRIASPQDRKAIDAWVEVHADQEQRKLVMSTLHQLPNGTAWFWSPEWGGKGLEQIAVRTPITFDSSATPKAGQTQIVPKKLAQADVEALTVKMGAVVAEAEQNDVRALRARITTLQKALDNALKVKPVVTEVERVVERPIVPKELVAAGLDLMGVLNLSGLESAITRFAEALRTNEWETAAYKIEIDRLKSPERKGGSRSQVAPVVRAERETATPNRTPTMADAKRHQRDGTMPGPSGGFAMPSVPMYDPLSEMTGPMRKLLIVLATYGPRTKRQLAMQSGYAENGGAFNNPLGKLRSLGYVTKGVPIEMTAEGKEALGDFKPLPIGQALIDHWMASTAVTGPMAKILQVLIDSEGVPYDRYALAEQTGYSPNGGAFNNPLGALRTLGLVAKGQPIMLTEEFAEAIK